MDSVQIIRSQFVHLYKNDKFVTDKSGVKVLELIGTNFLANEDIIFGKLDLNYLKNEISWYLSEDLNIRGLGESPPKEWIKSADRDGFINSNYGYLIFNDKNYNQYDNVVKELVNNTYSRRAVMIYTRPRIWIDYNWMGRNDFICTNDVQYFIRDGKLDCVVNMRSNDAIFGYKNDKYFQDFVVNKLLESINAHGIEVEKGRMIWNAGSLHIYERHFYLVDNYIKTGELYCKKYD